LKPGARTEVFEHGNPIRPPDPTIDRGEARARFGLGAGPVALVVGGSQGARSVNEALLADLRAVAAGRLPAPPPDLEILWATGPANHAAIAARLAEVDPGLRVHAVPYIQDMQGALASADLA